MEAQNNCELCLLFCFVNHAKKETRLLLYDYWKTELIVIL